MARFDGKRPGRLTLIPSQNGRCMIWDVTAADTLAPSYFVFFINKGRSSGRASCFQEVGKYLKLASTHIFCPLAFESIGPTCEEGLIISR